MSDARPDSNPGVEPITVLDLFAGCGGLTEGFHQFRSAHRDGPVFWSVGAVEWDRAAAASYAINFGKGSPRSEHHGPTEIFRRDVVGWDPSRFKGKIDVVVGGPPCQGFSGLNRERVGAERNKLWQEFIRIVCEVQPKVFVIENVDRFVRSPEFADLRKRIGDGDLGNYELCEPPGVKPSETDEQRARRYRLNAADYGAMQARYRAIVIGVRTDAGLDPIGMQYPEPTHSRDRWRNRSSIDGLPTPDLPQQWNTVNSLFDRTATMRLVDNPDPQRIARIPDLWGELKFGDLNGPFRTSDLHFTRSPQPISLSRYEAIPPGGNRKNLRGRFVCRFLDGTRDVILEKAEQWRDAEGKIDPRGRYRKVVSGKVTCERGEYEVRGVDSSDTFVRESAGRNKAQRFRVTVVQCEEKHPAVLEYLSTDSWDEHDAGSCDVMGRVHRNAPSVTIRTEFFKPEKGRYLHPTDLRPITHYEAAMLQGFPEDFMWFGSKTAIAKQIGNAVPIPLGTAIAGAIFEYLRPARF